MTGVDHWRGDLTEGDSHPKASSERTYVNELKHTKEEGCWLGGLYCTTTEETELIRKSIPNDAPSGEYMYILMGTVLVTLVIFLVWRFGGSSTGQDPHDEDKENRSATPEHQKQDNRPQNNNQPNNHVVEVVGLLHALVKKIPWFIALLLIYAIERLFGHK